MKIRVRRGSQATGLPLDRSHWIAALWKSLTNEDRKRFV